MIHLSPTASYGLISMLVLCLLLGAVSLPNATRWFQGSHASIQQDIIVLLGNNTTLKSSSTFGYNEWKQYDKNLIAADNTPMPAESGLQGILYDRGLSCSPTVNNTLPLAIHESAWKVNMSRIALIQLGECQLVEKLEYAQTDGASAVIFYSNTTNATLDHIDPGTIFIPAYHVDTSTGQELYQRLYNLTSWDRTRQQLKPPDESSEEPLHLVTRVTLYPDQQAFMEPWQFALIVIGVVVFTSLIIILVVQCHLVGKRRRQRRRQDPYEEHQDDQVNESFWLQLLSAATTDENDNGREKKPRYRLHPSVLETLPIRQWDGPDDKKIDQCVICLESFAKGDTLRTLVCEHEYHRDCIDVWLTKKNACCPLCLQLAVTLPTLPDPIHHQDHHALAHFYSEPRLLNTSHNAPESSLASNHDTAQGSDIV